MEALGNMDEAIKRFDAAKALISSDPRVDATKLGAIGYCFGGAVSLHMARIGTDLDVIGVFHGSLGTKKPMARGVFGGKILVANGAADPMVPKEHVDAFKKEMDKAKASYEVVEYENAKHAFTNPAPTENGAKFSLPLEYNAEADAASWQKLTELLAQSWGQ
jgi:dienelactone hydrolase